MSNTKHGPTPFKFGKTHEDQRMVLDAKGKYVCNVQIHQTPRSFGLFDEPQREANAAFIVRAANSHQILIDGLKAALENGELGDWQSARRAINEALAAAEAA